MNDLCTDITVFISRLGENNLDMDTVQVIADVLRVSDSLTHLG